MNLIDVASWGQNIIGFCFCPGGTGVEDGPGNLGGSPATLPALGHSGGRGALMQLKQNLNNMRLFQMTHKPKYSQGLEQEIHYLCQGLQIS